jgi:lipopolysaccharide transport system ATP-binding protein
MSTVIKFENLSKQYRLGQVGTGTISHDVNRWWHKIRGKEDPYLRIGESNDRTVKGDSDYVWALKDINFEEQQVKVMSFFKLIQFVYPLSVILKFILSVTKILK